MGDSTTRAFALLGLVVVVWVFAYWLYEPASQRHVLLDERPIRDVEPPAPALPEPRSLPPVPGRESVEEPEPRIEPAPTPGPDEMLIPPQFDDYTVRRGETLQDIARRVYGDPARWTAIARANPLLTPNKLKPGVTVIRLPRDPDNIQGKVVRREPVTPRPPEAAPPPPASPAPATGGWRTYTVQESDTLWGIAKKLYGRPSLSNLIAEANTDVLPDPDRLRAGITLKIPPAPPSD